MADVIDLNRRKSKERRISEGRQRRRAEAVAAAMSCGVCPRRCAHCGMVNDDPVPPTRQIPFPLCPACREELGAYRQRQGHPGEKEAFWHTDEWAEMWRAWLEFMESAHKFRRSSAFETLIEEFRD